MSDVAVTCPCCKSEMEYPPRYALWTCRIDGTFVNVATCGCDPSPDFIAAEFYRQKEQES